MVCGTSLTDIPTLPVSCLPVSKFKILVPSDTFAFVSTVVVAAAFSLCLFLLSSTITLPATFTAFALATPTPTSVAAVGCAVDVTVIADTDFSESLVLDSLSFTVTGLVKPFIVRTPVPATFIADALGAVVSFSTALFCTVVLSVSLTSPAVISITGALATTFALFPSIVIL